MLAVANEFGIALPISMETILQGALSPEARDDGRTWFECQEIRLSCKPLDGGAVVYAPLGYASGSNQAPLIVCSLLGESLWELCDPRGLLVFPVTSAEPTETMTYTQLADLLDDRPARWIDFANTPLAKILKPGSPAERVQDGEAPRPAPVDLDVAPGAPQNPTGSPPATPDMEGAAKARAGRIQMVAALLGDEKADSQALEEHLRSAQQQMQAASAGPNVLPDVNAAWRELQKNREELLRWMQDNPNSSLPNPISAEALLGMIVEKADA